MIPKPEHSDYRLTLTLPSDWKVVDARLLREALGADRTAAIGASLNVISLLAGVDAINPDLTAVLAVPYLGGGDRVAGVLEAGLAATVVSMDQLPPGFEDLLGADVVSGVEFGSQDVRSCVVYTDLLRSSDGIVGALLSFASPNVEVQDALLLGFKELASAASLGSDVKSTS